MPEKKSDRSRSRSRSKSEKKDKKDAKKGKKDKGGKGDGKNKSKDSSRSRSKTPDSKKGGKGKKAAKGKKGKKKKKTKNKEVEKKKKIAERTASQLAALEELRKQKDFEANWDTQYKTPFVRHVFKKRVWPKVTKVRINTKPWEPPVIQKPERTVVVVPPFATRRWIPPQRRRRRKRAPLQRIPPEEVTMILETMKLNKVWHSFSLVQRGKMMLQGSTACNSKRFGPQSNGNQTAAIAVVGRCVIYEKDCPNLLKGDIDDIITHGDKYNRASLIAMRCYHGNFSLKPSQLLSYFYRHDKKYTVKIIEKEKALLAKHPDSPGGTPDLMSIMEKNVGKKYMNILSVGEKHFLIWGGPPEGGGNVRTVSYLLDPHMLTPAGFPTKVAGSGAILRYAGVKAFVRDFLANYGQLNPDRTDSPTIQLWDVEVVTIEDIERYPNLTMQLETVNIHCENEWETLNFYAMLEKKAKPTVSQVSMATSKSRKNVSNFFKKAKDIPDAAPPPTDQNIIGPSFDELVAMRGEDFFLYTPGVQNHMFGRDELLAVAKSEVILHSMVDIEETNFHSQYRQVDAEMWLLRSTRHACSKRYQDYKCNNVIPVCIAGLAMLRKRRARAWNEDMLDEALDVGYQLYQDTLSTRGGEIRKFILGELNDTFPMAGSEFTFKLRGCAVWGRLTSTAPNCLDLTSGLEEFFKESDAGILQVPGEVEVAIWHEGGKYYMFDPMPADKKGNRVGIREGGKGYLASFSRIGRLCEHFIHNLPPDKRRKPYSIADISITEKKELPEPVYKFKAIAPKRWIVSGRFNEADGRFPEPNRGKQGVANTVAALAIAHVHDPATWTQDNVDQSLIRGDILYGQTMDQMERKDEGGRDDGGGSPNPMADRGGGGDEYGGEDGAGGPGMATATLSPGQLNNKFRVSEYDCIETEVLDGMFHGSLNSSEGNTPNLRESLQDLFREFTHAVVICRNQPFAVFRHEDHFYYFDPKGCDENGYRSDEPRAAACLLRVEGPPADLAEIIESNLSPGSDDTFSISPVLVTCTRMNEEAGVPETKLQSPGFEWINSGTAAVMMGAQGEHTAYGKAATKAGVDENDVAGRLLALPAAAAFTAACALVQPPHMHRDHMHNFIEAGAEYYLAHLKKTGREEITVDDLNEKFELGANTFSIKVGEPIEMPLRIPDEPIKGEGGDEEEEELGEEEEIEEKNPIRDIKGVMYATMIKPNSLALLIGDYHQLGVWCDAAGQVVTFDPAPTLKRGLLPMQRIVKGDQLRMMRLEEMKEVGEEDEDDMGDDEGDEEEVAGEQKSVASLHDRVPPDAAPVLAVYASPGEFIDKLVLASGLNNAQMIAPYKLYPVTVTNQLTSVLKESGDEDENKEGEEGDEEAKKEKEPKRVIEELPNEALGKHFHRINKTIGNLRGRVSQNEEYFMENPNRDNQDVPMAVIGLVVDNIEPYIYWKPSLVDALLKYGDRLYTCSLPNSRSKPRVLPIDVVKEFHVTNFKVKIDVDPDIIRGDIKAHENSEVMSLKKGLVQFFQENTHGILCAKEYCVGIFKAADGKSIALWEPHAVGPTGKSSPGGAAGVILFSEPGELADIFLSNIEALARPGNNRYSISAVKVKWEYREPPMDQVPGTVPDAGYENKVLTAFVEIGKGRTILRGNVAPDMYKFTRDTLLQSSCGAIVGVCMAHIRRPELWTKRTVDEVIAAGGRLFSASLAALGYEFRPDEDVLLPLQVLKRFVLGANYVKFDLDNLYSGKLDHSDPTEMSVRCALEQFLQTHTHGILWSPPHAVGIWRNPKSSMCYMWEPHSCGAAGLRSDGLEDGAACLLSFSSPKLMAFSYLQNVPPAERALHDFQIYKLSANIHAIKPMGGVEPPLITNPPGALPATSKVNIDGTKRRAIESERYHPPGDVLCEQAQRLMEAREKDAPEGKRNDSGWLVTNDGCQYLSADHSQSCRRYSQWSRGWQSIANSIMALAMSRADDICRWDKRTLGAILDSGDQLYKDSYLHFKPQNKHLSLQQVLRKFFTPNNCFCRVIVYEPRHGGYLPNDLYTQLNEFFREERTGVFLVETFAVALFRTPRGYYIFDPDDRDRYGRPAPPQCKGRARACLSLLPNVQAVAEKIALTAPVPSNPPPPPPDSKSMQMGQEGEATMNTTIDNTPTTVPNTADQDYDYVPFAIYGVDVTQLKRVKRKPRYRQSSHSISQRPVSNSSKSIM